MHNQATSASGAYTGLLTARTGQAASPAESPSGIRDALTHSEEMLGAIHAALSHLESRLDTVITPIPPSPSTEASRTPTPMIAMSHMRERLGNFNSGLSDALARLNTLRDRIEV